MGAPDSRLRLPPRHFRRALVVRTAVVWAGAHVFVMILGGAAAQGGGMISGLTFNLLQAIWLWPFVIGAILIESRQRQEHLFLGNLGVSQGSLAAFLVLVCAALELVLTLALASFA